MTKEKIASLTKYQTQLRDKLSDKTIPAKHINRPENYKKFLTNELRLVTLTIEAANMAAAPTPSK